MILSLPRRQLYNHLFGPHLLRLFFGFKKVLYLMPLVTFDALGVSPDYIIRHNSGVTLFLGNDSDLSANIVFEVVVPGSSANPRIANADGSDLVLSIAPGVNQTKLELTKGDVLRVVHTAGNSALTKLTINGV